MLLVRKTAQLAVYDEAVTPDQFAALGSWVSKSVYRTPSSAEGWVKIWRLGDGEPMATGPSYLSKGPFNSPLDAVAALAIEAARLNPDIIKPYRDIVFSTYLYTRGIKLSWHFDGDVFSGAFNFYVHPYWASTWGGEFMFAETPPADPSRTAYGAHPDFGHGWEDQQLAAIGIGSWLLPKPNRMVIIAPGTFHSVNRVDADAGDNVRCAITAFYQR